MNRCKVCHTIRVRCFFQKSCRYNLYTFFFIFSITITGMKRTNTVLCVWNGLRYDVVCEAIQCLAVRQAQWRVLRDIADRRTAIQSQPRVTTDTHPGHKVKLNAAGTRDLAVCHWYAGQWMHYHWLEVKCRWVPNQWVDIGSPGPLNRRARGLCSSERITWTVCWKSAAADTQLVLVPTSITVLVCRAETINWPTDRSSSTHQEFLCVLWDP